MGCDIHIFVEKKIGDKWVAIRGKYPMEDHVIHYLLRVFINDNKNIRIPISN